MSNHFTRRLALGAAAIALAIAAPAARADSAGAGQSYIPGRVGVRGTVPNPGTQQQELANITFPAPYNVFEFTVTCAGCHGGTIDQQIAHFGVQAGSAMASSARDPVFRANQIAVNNILKAVSGEDGAGNMCMRCHSPNGWYSGRFDPTLGGDAEGRTMLHSIVLSTDDEGVSCEQCHRAVGNVKYKPAALDPNLKAWNLMAGIGGYPADPGWSHDGKGFVDQAGDPTAHPGGPYGDTTLQYADGMTYNGPFSGTVYPYFSDNPWLQGWAATDFTGQIFGVYPPGDPRAGKAVVNADGSVSPTYDLPVSAPIDFAKSNFTTSPPTIVYDFQAQSMSLEHPTASNGFVTKSEFCASCHELTVPVLNHGMPEQRTYTEWAFSAYAKATASAQFGIPVAKGRSQGEVRCQDCHMPQVRHEYADNAAAGPNADPALTGWFPYAKDRNLDGGTSKHTHAGANRDLAAMMKYLYPEPDLEVLGVATGPDIRVFPGMLSTRDPMYDRNIRSTEISMADAVSVAIASAPREVSAGVYEVQVQVTNRTGHRIPTGYPDGRRMWVQLDVKDAAGAVVYRSGQYDQADAKLYTDPSAKAFRRAQTNVIDATVTGGNAVMVYERVTCRDGLVAGAPLNDGAPDGICEDLGSPFLPNNRIMFDNRIPPAGFTYADYRAGGVKFWNYGWAPNPNAGGADRPVPCEDAPGYTAQAGAFGGSCAGVTAQRYPDGQGFDLVTYRFAAPAGLALSARAEINWQTHTREFMEQLRDQQESLGLTDTVRPQGPINPTMAGYPVTPSYLSDVIGLAAIQDPYNPGVPLRDNWGGVAYAAWLATGKGAPAVVAAADSAVTAVPAAPATVTAAATPGVPFETTVSWAEVAGADGYVVYILYGCQTRAQLPDGTLEGGHCYDPVLDASLTPVSTVGVTTQWDRLAIVKPSACAAGTCSLVNTAMNVNKSYGFKVAAFNAAGLGAESAPITHVTPWDLPLAPDLLKLLAITPTSATLAWTDTADSESIFAVQLVPVLAPQPPLAATLTPAANGFDVLPPPAPEVIYTTITQTPGLMGFGGNQLTITGLAPDTAYNVQVQACNATACSGMNTNGPIQIRTQILVGTPILNTPSVMQNPLRIALSWTVATGATSYVVERSTNAGATWTAFPAVTGTTYSDTAVAAASTYDYRVTAYAGTIASSPSNVQNVVTPVGLAVPGIGTATGPTKARVVTVTWTYTNQGQTGFRVYRNDVTTGATVAMTTANAGGTCGAAPTSPTLRSCTLTLPALPAAQSTAEVYQFTVSALQKAIETLPSQPSNQLTLKPAIPAAPTSLAVSAPTGTAPGSLRVRFADNSANERGFWVERRFQTRTACSGAGSTTWSAYTTATLPQWAAYAGTGTRTVYDTGLTSGCRVRYQYRIRSFNDGGTSAWTGWSTAISAP